MPREDRALASSAPSWLAVLSATLSLQIAVSAAAQALPVLGPLILGDAGLEREAIGYLTFVAAAGTALYLATGSPLMARVGPVRALQAGAAGVGIAMLGLASGEAAILYAAVLLRGLGEGPSLPAATRIMARAVPPEHRTLIFSVRQAGVPMGGLIAGLALPPLAGLLGWRAALLATAALVLACTLAVQPLREPLDADRDPGRAIGLSALLAPSNVIGTLAAIGAHRALPVIQVVGVSLAFQEGCLFAFAVTLLVGAHGYTTTQAGTVFAMLQVGAFLARIGLGWLADRTGVPMVNLLVQLLVAAAATASFAVLPHLVPFPLMVVAALLIGAATASWAGIIVAEFSRLAPHDRVAEAMAGGALCSLLARMAGPAVFSLLVHATGSWTLPMLCIAALAGGVGMLVAPRVRHEARCAPVERTPAGGIG